VSTQIEGIEEIAATLDRTTDFARSLCDPTALMNCRTGDVYVRTDGAKWKWPAYIIRAELDLATGAVKSRTVEEWTCKEDSTVYDDGQAKRAQHKQSQKGKAA